MDLKNFVSNEKVIRELTYVVESGNIPHAMIIDGAKGTGKKTLAKILAQSCVCLSESSCPCGECAGCVKALHGTHPDIYVADGNIPGSLTIDSIRTIRTDAYIIPNEAPRKVYLILDCDKMQPASQNALLKILEEPPKNVVFILTVTSSNMLLQTVRSRSRVYTLYPPGVEQTAKYVEEIFPDKDKEEILSAARLNDGNIGKTIADLESGSEQAKELADSILKAVTVGKEYDLLIFTGKLSESRDFAARVMDILFEDAAECIKASIGMETNLEAARVTAGKLSPSRVYKLAENIGKAKDVLKTNVNLNFFGTWLCAMLRNS